MNSIEMNIPNKGIADIIERLAFLYVNAINKGISLKSIPSPFLWGAAGIGKSQGVYQLAEMIEAKPEKQRM